MSSEEIDDLFSYHAPTEDQIDRIAKVREACRIAAQAINTNCPGSPDASAAIRKVGEASMTANRAIVREGWMQG
jgi:hypothetical protein